MTFFLPSVIKRQSFHLLFFSASFFRIYQLLLVEFMLERAKLKQLITILRSVYKNTFHQSLFWNFDYLKVALC